MQTRVKVVVKQVLPDHDTGRGGKKKGRKNLTFCQQLDLLNYFRAISLLNTVALKKI